MLPSDEKNSDNQTNQSAHTGQQPWPPSYPANDYPAGAVPPTGYPKPQSDSACRDSKKNAAVQFGSFLKYTQLAHMVDSWRIFPRVFISTYIYLLYEVVIWYMLLQAPSAEQSAFVSVVVGVGAAWFGLYTGSGTRKN